MLKSLFYSKGIFKPTSSNNLFGFGGAAPAATTGGLFVNLSTSSSGLFGQVKAAAPPTSTAPTPAVTSIFGQSAKPANPFSAVANAAATAAPTSPAAPVTVNPFTAVANSAQKQVEETMDGGLSFGGLGFGAAKQASSEPPKNVFGAGFGGVKPATTAEQPKGVFGGGFAAATTTATTQSTGVFGASVTAQPATATGNLFSSFKTPQKTAGKHRPNPLVFIYSSQFSYELIAIIDCSDVTLYLF